jgi:predicted DNA-binding transcriptional regulator AlpA
MKAEGFPKPIEFSGKAHRWWLEDVENWVNERKFSDE